MKKKVTALIITLFAVFSLNAVVVYADAHSGTNPGINPVRPLSAPLCPPPVCPDLEDCQGEDEDN